MDGGEKRGERREGRTSEGWKKEKKEQGRRDRARDGGEGNIKTEHEQAVALHSLSNPLWKEKGL
jgi:hypothetical protein